MKEQMSSPRDDSRLDRGSLAQRWTASTRVQTGPEVQRCNMVGERLKAASLINIQWVLGARVMHDAREFVSTRKPQRNFDGSHYVRAVP